jgi:amino acid adenylation domain-containing protein
MVTPPAPGLPLAAANEPAGGGVHRREFPAPAAAGSLALAVYAEVLRAWSGTAWFGIRVRAAEGVDSLAVAVDEATFSERLSALRTLPAPPDGEFPITYAENVTGALPADVNLELRLTDLGGDLRCEWHSRDDAFPRRMAEDMFEAFRGLLGVLAAGSSRTSRRFDLLPRWQQDVIAQAQDTAVPVPGGLLHTAAAEQALLCPDAPAVLTAERQLTYREFGRRVNQIGRTLRDLGVRPNQLVAVVMDKGWEQIVAAHGVLTAGAAYLPVDAATPAERLRVILAHGEVGIVLTQSAVEDRVEWPAEVQRLCVDRDFDDADGAPLTSVATPDDLAYVIFTSGSTGMPKGVMVEHRAAVNHIAESNRTYGIGRDDRCLAVSGLHFDLSVYDTFGPLSAGGAVVVPNPSPKPDPGHWSQLLDRHGVTLWNSVPALMEMLVLYLEVTRCQAQARSLRTVMLGGDWIPVSLPSRISELCPDARQYSIGGPAETVVWSVRYPIERVDPAWTSIPYGRGVANQEYHVLDEERRPCPVWVPGEMYVVSDVGLARGYWRDEERTTRQFVTLPTGRRAYATGDMGRFLPSGDLEFLGRKDFQVKIQGVRIELGDIEAAIGTHPAVIAAVVVATGKPRELPILRAYVVLAGPDTEPDADGLREFLAAKLPKAMVPNVITLLDALPLTGNGKVDRRALTAVG